jgi:erythromycin esterase-like protein
MRTTSDLHPVNAICRTAHPLTGESTDFDPLLKMIGDSRFVLIGEASHGTHEFYRLRAQITKRLITEKGFNAVAVEADWPDAYRINQFVRFQGKDQDAIDALAGFKRFPAWMWRNADVLDFVGWLRNYNEHRHSTRAGFYGLDLCSLHASIRAVLNFLDKVDPEAAHRARYRYSCFEDFGEDTQAYVLKRLPARDCTADIAPRPPIVAHRSEAAPRCNDRMRNPRVLGLPFQSVHRKYCMANRFLSQFAPSPARHMQDTLYRDGERA